MIPVHVSAEQVQRFAELSGDVNPLHTDRTYARATPFGRPVAHGALAVLSIWCVGRANNPIALPRNNEKH